MTENIMIRVVSVNISTQKGTIKKAVDSIFLDANGIKNDAHSGDWHRQVSLLGIESVKRFEAMANRPIAFGEFAENITTEGFELFHALPLDVFENDSIKLQVTQIGKKCHGDSCAIYREVGNCVMPKEGIFARVIKGGVMKSGDVLNYYPKVLKIKVITLSDRASRGEYEDKSGPRIIELLDSHFNALNRPIFVEYHLIPDDRSKLTLIIQESIASGIDVIFTTGGTGVSDRDITVETIKPFLTKEVTGIMDFIRLKYGNDKPNALLSRGVAGFASHTLIYTLPGSVKAVNEYMSEILKTLQHLIFMHYGIDNH